MLRWTVFSCLRHGLLISLSRYIKNLFSQNLSNGWTFASVPAFQIFLFIALIREETRRIEPLENLYSLNWKVGLSTTLKKMPTVRNLVDSAKIDCSSGLPPSLINFNSWALMSWTDWAMLRNQDKRPTWVKTSKTVQNINRTEFLFNII